jgi:hypothetical protein
MMIEVQYEYWRSEGVFVGTVKSQKMVKVKEDRSDETYLRKVHFIIEQSFKGITGKEVDVVTGLSGADCGYRFETGGRYLVYASLVNAKNTYWYTGFCHRTLPLEEAEEDLAFIRDLPKAGSGGSVLGRVTQLSSSLQDEEQTKFWRIFESPWKARTANSWRSQTRMGAFRSPGCYLGNTIFAPNSLKAMLRLHGMRSMLLIEAVPQ